MPDEEQSSTLIEPVTCTACSADVEMNDAIKVNGAWLCQGCEGELETCDECGDYCEDDSGGVDGDTWCRDCINRFAFTCVCCDHRFHSRTRIESRDGSICENCGDNYYSSCESCDDYCHNEDLRYGYCPGCYDNRRKRSNLVHYYDYKPTAIFHGGAGIIHYGVELEVDTDSGNADRVLKLLGGEDHAYLKEDGSIDNGFEIVTHPHTMKAHKDLWPPLLKELGSYADASGNGMHAHIQRFYLKRIQIQKMLDFLNMESNKTFVVYIAERDNYQYAAIKTDLMQYKRIRDRHSAACRDRYQALNLTNQKTIEVRIFRGTVEPTRFWKNMEFCEALVHWTRNQSYSHLTYQEFCSHVRKNRKQWLNLDNFLVAGKYLKRATGPEALNRKLPLKPAKQEKRILTCV